MQDRKTSNRTIAPKAASSAIWKLVNGFHASSPP
jgi:hypothetical protein